MPKKIYQQENGSYVIKIPTYDDLPDPSLDQDGSLFFIEDSGSYILLDMASGGFITLNGGKDTMYPVQVDELPSDPQPGIIYCDGDNLYTYNFTEEQYHMLSNSALIPVRLYADLPRVGDELALYYVSERKQLYYYDSLDDVYKQICQAGYMFQVQTQSELPQPGIPGAIYYVLDTNKKYIYAAGMPAHWIQRQDLKWIIEETDVLPEYGNKGMIYLTSRTSDYDIVQTSVEPQRYTLYPKYVRLFTDNNVYVDGAVSDLGITHHLGADDGGDSRTLPRFAPEFEGQLSTQANLFFDPAQAYSMAKLDAYNYIAEGKMGTDGMYIELEECNLVSANKADFPMPGVDSKLYYAIDQFKLYRFDVASNSYKLFYDGSAV